MKRFIFLLLLVCGPAYGQGYLADIEHSATSVLLPVMCLRSLGDTPPGGTFKSGITASTSGLTISVKADNASSWTVYSQAAGTINNKASSLGTWETPDTNDAELTEAGSEGCYQLDLADSTWSVASAKYVQIKWDDGGSTFADTLFTVNLNAIAAADLVDLVWDEPVSGHTTADTTGDQVGAQSDTDTTNIRNDISGLSDGSSPVYVIGKSIQTGTCASGSTTTCVDTNLAEADTDYWANGVEIYFSSGNAQKQSRCITGFVPGEDKVVFSPPTTAAIAVDDNYILSANAACGALSQTVEDQDGGYSAADILSLLLSESMGVCTYTSGTRQWTCSDPGGGENRFTITYGAELDGDRTSTSTTPATP